MLCGHGSRDGEAMGECETLRGKIAHRCGVSVRVRLGYLEFNEPTLPETLHQLHKEGVDTVAMMPMMLLAGHHARRDIPAISEDFHRRHSSMTIVNGGDIGFDERMLAIVRQRIAKSLPTPAPPADDTVLLVVGRGNGDEAINDQLRALVAMMEQACGYRAMSCFAGLARPTIDEGLQQASEMARHVIILPYLLFAGLLTRRITEAWRRAVKTHPHHHYYLCSWLGAHDLLADILAERSCALLGITQHATHRAALV